MSYTQSIQTTFVGLSIDVLDAIFSTPDLNIFESSRGVLQVLSTSKEIDFEEVVKASRQCSY